MNYKSILGESIEIPLFLLLRSAELCSVNALDISSINL